MKNENEGLTIRPMTIGDYPKVHKLWLSIRGFGIRSIDDSEEGVGRFLLRNPTTSVVALDEKGEVVGSILCGHDGRTAFFYHVCVREDVRRQGIGKAMVLSCMRALERERVSKITLFAFQTNSVGNEFWKAEGWQERPDMNTYEFILNEKNITRFNR